MTRCDEAQSGSFRAAATCTQLRTGLGGQTHPSRLRLCDSRRQPTRTEVFGGFALRAPRAVSGMFLGLETQNHDFQQKATSRGRTEPTDKSRANSCVCIG